MIHKIQASQFADGKPLAQTTKCYPCIFQKHLFIFFVRINNPCHPGIINGLKETITGEARADYCNNSFLACWKQGISCPSFYRRPTLCCQKVTPLSAVQTAENAFAFLPFFFLFFFVVGGERKERERGGVVGWYLPQQIKNYWIKL